MARGFHRIEKAVGVLGTTEGQEEYARQLMENVTNLREGVETVELEPEDPLMGSVELLNEVSAGKFKDEEDRDTRTDLYDTNANIEGSEVAFEELKPEVAGEDVTLANDVVEGLEGVYEELERRRARRRIRGRYAAPPADGRVLRRPLGGRGDGEAGVSALPRPGPPHRGPRRGAGALAGLDGGHGAHDAGQTGSREDRERGHAPV